MCAEQVFKRPRTRSSRKKIEERERKEQENIREAFIDLLVDTATSYCPQCSKMVSDDLYDSDEVDCDCIGIRDCPDCIKLSSKLKDGSVVLCEVCH